MERPIRDGALIVTMKFGNIKEFPFSEFPHGLDWTIKDRILVVPTGRRADGYSRKGDTTGMKFINLDYVVEWEEIENSDKYRAEVKEFQRQCDHEWDEPPPPGLFTPQQAPHCKKCDVCMADLDLLYDQGKEA